MIITLTLLTLLHGGGGPFSFEKDFEPFVKDAVADKARYEQIVGQTKLADQDIEQFKKEVEDVWAEELKTLLSDYDADEGQFRAFIERADQSRTALQQKLLYVRFQVVDLMSEDEWNAMYQAMEEKAKEKKKSDGKDT